MGSSTEMSDSEVLVPSSQSEQNARPRKRRRLSRDGASSSPTEEGDYDLPENEEREGKENKKSKYDDRIYVPAGERQPDTFVTQLDQQYSSPSRIRGPRWMKPQENPPSHPSPRVNRPGASPRVQTAQSGGGFDEFDFDDDDFELMETLEASATVQGIFPVGTGIPPNSGVSHPRQPLQRVTSLRQTTLHGAHTTQQELPRTQTQSRAHNWPLANRNEPPTHHEINKDAMSTWVYPTNLGRIRDYQYNITHKGLFNNILVALPTGLGKTFIAATIMLNWYRWTKDAKIIFVAPAKPLVAQQIDACFNIAGIPRSETTMLTGEVQPAIRAEEWQNKRVFFMTPQTLINDLKHGYCDPKKVVLLVVDEAHKATGGYAYVEVVKFLRRYNNSFRVLALTATPGKDVEKVQEVIDGLGIARVEIRTDESLDIRDFVHSRNVEMEIFENSEEMTMALEMLAKTIQPLLNKLCQQGAAHGKDPTRLTLFGLREAVSKWGQSEAGKRAAEPIKAMVRAVSVPLMSLAHSIELLKYHGIGPFYQKLKAFVDEPAGKGKYRKQILDDEHFKTMMNRLNSWINNPDFIGHPKLSHLQEVILNHFMNRPPGGDTPDASGTRIMVFTHFRDSAEEIVRVLDRHKPMVRAHVFVGQSNTKGGSEGMNQKKQQEIITKFKAGTYNTIVATSIGEEGLDIGEVDLILCFDCSKSPIRMLQRMGRTGRKRAGNIVLLVMKGKEEEDFHKSEDNYKKMQKKITDGRDFTFHDEVSPRIVPKEIIPAADKRQVEIPIENTQAGSIEPTRRKAKNAKKPAKKFHMPDGVEIGFSFLGGGKKSKANEKQKESTKRNTTDHVVPLPPSKEAYLTGEEAQQLEDRYLQLAGDQDEYTHQVEFDAFPEQWRKLGKTGLVRHSTKTKTMVRAIKAMRIDGRDWDQPVECPDIDDDIPLAGDDGEISKIKTPASRSKSSSRTSSNMSKNSTASRRSSTKTGSPVITLHPNGLSSGTFRSSSIGEYDDNDSFIDDENDTTILTKTTGVKKPAPRTETAYDDEDLESIASLPSLPDVEAFSSVKARAPPKISQKSIDYDASDDELPDLETLFSTTKNPTDVETNRYVGRVASSPTPSLTLIEQDAITVKTIGRQRARRVVDSEEEE